MFALGNYGNAVTHTHMQANPTTEYVWPCAAGGERILEAY